MMRHRLLARLICAMFPFSALAHPADEIQTRLLIGMQNGKVTHIGESWTFDSSVSQWLLDTYDTNGNGAFDADELPGVHQAMKQNTQDSYYTRLWVKDQQVEAPHLYGFQATVKDGVATLAFALALPEPTDPNALRVELYDHDNLMGLIPVRNKPVILRGLTEGQTCVPNLAVNQPDMHGGPDNIPVAVTLACK